MWGWRPSEEVEIWEAGGSWEGWEPWLMEVRLTMAGSVTLWFH